MWKIYPDEKFNGYEEYQGGSIHIRKGAKLGYLEQIYHIEGSTEVEEVLWQAFKKAIEIKKELQNLEKTFATLDQKHLEQAMAKYGQYVEAYERLDGYQLETKVNQVCEGLDISTLRKMTFGSLSGGERTG
ncbi:hypothetical protein [Natranaerovirga hydrolytica]|uniref:hypothetical protein n=1 Tax=Natranaerovirga hydrolytica TaxID=680378 RepID=UPI0026A8F474